VPTLVGPSRAPTLAPGRAITGAPTALAACIVVLSSRPSGANLCGGAQDVVVNAGARLRLAGWSASAGDEATMDRALAWQWNCTNATVVSGSGSGAAALVVDGRPALVTGRFLSWDLPPMTTAVTYVFTLLVTGPAAQARDQASPSKISNWSLFIPVQVDPYVQLRAWVVNR
jgi:hypothetical protein